MEPAGGRVPEAQDGQVRIFEGYQHVNKERNAMAHHRRSPEIEIQPAWVFMHDVRRALSG